MYLKKEFYVCALKESWKMLMIMMKMACYFWQQQLQKKEKQLTTDGRKGGRGGGRAGRKEGRHT